MTGSKDLLAWMATLTFRSENREYRPNTLPNVVCRLDAKGMNGGNNDDGREEGPNGFRHPASLFLSSTLFAHPFISKHFAGDDAYYNPSGSRSHTVHESCCN